ncbi:MAG: Tex family protein [Verrucomicrobiota bacterium]|nr:Tex family protein [Verrucomicrobiota bacterium]
MLEEKHIVKIAKELSVTIKQVAATALLLEQGSTVPFISRYRKEMTGMLDEVQVANIRDRLEQLKELDSRRDSILKSLEERSLLTEELKAKINAAETLSTLEDLYLPFRPKKRTRAMAAKEKGLEPLALKLWEQEEGVDPAKEAALFVDPTKEVKDVSEALAGARDIIAELVNENAVARAKMRELYITKGVMKSKGAPDKETEGAKFKDYFDWSEQAATAPSHRILAIRRGEKEGFLYYRISVEETEASGILERLFVKNNSSSAQQVREAVADCYKRLLSFAMEAEARIEFKKRADEEAIRVFAENIRELLMAPPLGQRAVLGIDPGFRTGCKIVCLDRQGKLLFNEVVYPEKSTSEMAEAATMIRALVQKFKIEAIAIGNGTAGRETEGFVKKLKLPPSLPIVMVNESGASIYSASEVAREEFPTHDLTVRGAVSIGRRLMDPLAELVKLDPKVIGVGQYQHDVDQNALKRTLDDVVASCVNRVGVEINTASKQLLSYVSGLNAQSAANIVSYRDENGPFKSREELQKVPRLGPKAFEQAAGFLRIRDGAHPLDSSAVHPERYSLVDKIAQDLSASVKDLLTNSALRQKIDLKKYVTEQVGLPTLQDIMNELSKPGRDPRQQFEAFSFTEGVNKMEDLKPGLKLPGIVTNVTAFGAFVDIGVHQDGLVHISQLSDNFVKNPAEVVKVQQHVTVTVMEVDIPRKRVSLSMKSNPEIGAVKVERKTVAAGGGGSKSMGSHSGGGSSSFGSLGSWFDDAGKGKK